MVMKSRLLAPPDIRGHPISAHRDADGRAIRSHAAQKIPPIIIRQPDVAQEEVGAGHSHLLESFRSREGDCHNMAAGLKVLGKKLHYIIMVLHE